jgi:hypothetical protein
MAVTLFPVTMDFYASVDDDLHDAIHQLDRPPETSLLLPRKAQKDLRAESP